MSHWGSVMSAGHDHGVKFYDHDDDVVETVARFVAEGYAIGENALVVATPQHRSALVTALDSLGVDTDRRLAVGELVLVDAADTLAGLMVDGRVDRTLFHERTSTLLDGLGASGRAIRAFGEMVSLLCAADDIVGAIELECLWQETLAQRDLTLLCSYANSVVGSATLADVSRLCELHTDVLTPFGYRSEIQLERAVDSHLGSHLGTSRASEVFLPARDAVGAARRFVTGVLEQWGDADIVDDAVIVMSEMASNAVTHGDSPFRATMDRSAHRLRVTVEDVDPRWPEHVVTTSESVSGRGMGIVEALSSRWGCDDLLTGKAVWAELLVPSTRLA